MIVYPARDIRPFVMYCVNGKPRSSLLIESTDSMILILQWTYRDSVLSSDARLHVEFLVLERMKLTFHEANIPHPNQSAYRKKTSCADAILATQEVISRYVEGGDRVLMCLYDLQKAFDSVEYPVLLKRLYDIGINGKMWRLIKNWYTGARCQVKLDGGYLSDPYPMERGVKQGSVLSPSLFLLIMDPLLTKLQSSGYGLSINNFYCGAFLHADDIRTLSTSPDSLNMQVTLVNNFANENFLKLNIQKCEVVLFSRSLHQGNDPMCEIDGSLLPVSRSGKCLGYWWLGDLSANKSVDENIKKARRTFFHYGSLGSFQGDLNPLSTGSIIQTCVMPVLLYGCENWVLSDKSITQLQSFLGEMAKRALKWPRHFSNTAALMVMGMESIQCSLLIRKLCFLKRHLCQDADGIESLSMRCLMDDPESTCLIRECRSLEGEFGTDYTDRLLGDADEVSMSELKKEIRRCDRERLSGRCAKKAPLLVEVNKSGGHWVALWDAVLHRGQRHTMGLQYLTRILAHHGHGSKPCPLCEDQLHTGQHLVEHILQLHADALRLPPVLTVDSLLTQIADGDVTILYKFWKIFSVYPPYC